MPSEYGLFILMNKFIKWFGFSLVVLVSVLFVYGIAFNAGKSGQSKVATLSPSTVNSPMSVGDQFLAILQNGVNALAGIQNNTAIIATNTTGIKSNTDNLVPAVADNAAATREVAGAVETACTTCGKKAETQTYTIPKYVPKATPVQTVVQQQPAAQVAQSPINVNQTQTVNINGLAVVGDEDTKDSGITMDLASYSKCSKTTACKIGARKCCGTGYQVCVTGSNGCPKWSGIKYCGGDSICKAGKCVPRCTPRAWIGCYPNEPRTRYWYDSCGHEDWTMTFQDLNALRCADDEYCSGGECITIVTPCPSGNCDEQDTSVPDDGSGDDSGDDSSYD